MKKDYRRPMIGFTAFKNRENTNLVRSASAIAIGSPEMGSQSFKVKELPKQ